MSLFTTVISKIPKRNAFNLSFENILSTEFGQIIPVSCKEILPGDTFRQGTECVVKTAPMLAPVFSRIDLYLHYFFVPARLLQSDWEDFITTGQDGTAINLTPPYCEVTDLAGLTPMGAEGSLQDYFNLPLITAADVVATPSIANLRINMLPFLAYQKIYSDWYRDELLDTFEFEPLAGGQLSSANRTMATTMRYRSWKKDYFTSARPYTQLGPNPNGVEIPLSGEITADGEFRFGSASAAVVGNGRVLEIGPTSSVEDMGSDFSDTRYRNDIRTAPQGELNNPSGGGVYYGDGLTLDSASVSIIELRRALRLQEWQERNMRGGNRYIENIFHHFGVKSSDARLQRSELLGGRKVPIVVSEVTQQSAQFSYSVDKETTPLGQLAGKGGTVANTGRIKWHAEEHGFILCLASVMPKAAYMQGLPRMYWRMNYLDYAWPLFGNIGEQEVYKGELFLNAANPESTFGYQSRYAEYKFSPNEVHGAFRSTMNYWHNARIFDSAPSLNNNFVQLNGGQDDSTNDGQNRIFPTLPDGYGHFYLHMYHDIKVIRALPKYGIPSI